jgi:hypothetical protein
MLYSDINKKHMNKETLEPTKDLAYWRANAEEDYMKVPISVLKYISELENRMYSEEEIKEAYWNRTDEMDVDGYWISDPEEDLEKLIEQLKKK